MQQTRTLQRASTLYPIVSMAQAKFLHINMDLEIQIQRLATEASDHTACCSCTLPSSLCEIE
jgi:hypothetical protein